MKFFLPEQEDKKLAIDAYGAIKKLAKRTTGVTSQIERFITSNTVTKAEILTNRSTTTVSCSSRPIGQLRFSLIALASGPGLNMAKFHLTKCRWSTI